MCSLCLLQSLLSSLSSWGLPGFWRGISVPAPISLRCILPSTVAFNPLGCFIASTCILQKFVGHRVRSTCTIVIKLWGRGLVVKFEANKSLKYAVSSEAWVSLLCTILTSLSLMLIPGVIGWQEPWVKQTPCAHHPSPVQPLNLWPPVSLCLYVWEQLSVLGVSCLCWLWLQPSGVLYMQCFPLSEGCSGCLQG